MKNVSSGLALESLITLLTVKFIPFFMLTWIISAFYYLPHSQWLCALTYNAFNSQRLRMRVPN